MNRLAVLVNCCYTSLERLVGDDFQDPGRREEARQALISYYDCRSQLDRLTWVAWALHEDHPHAVLDYADLLDITDPRAAFRFLDLVQEEGLNAFFGEDEIDAFLAEPYDPATDDLRLEAAPAYHELMTMGCLETAA